MDIIVRRFEDFMPSYDWKPVERWYQLPPGQTYVRECSWMVSVGHIRHVMYFIHWFIHFTLSSYLLGIFLVATLDSVTHDILPIQWGLEISMDLSGEAKRAKIPEPWKWQVEIIGEAGTGRRTKIWTSRHWLQWSQKQLTHTHNLACDSGRIVDFEKIYLKFIHSIINDILFLA